MSNTRSSDWDLHIAAAMQPWLGRTERASGGGTGQDTWVQFMHDGGRLCRHVPQFPPSLLCEIHQLFRPGAVSHCVFVWSPALQDSPSTILQIIINVLRARSKAKAGGGWGDQEVVGLLWGTGQLVQSNLSEEKLGNCR